LQEYSRRGNFIRIFPAKGSDSYDAYFSQIRPLNRFVFKVLYSNELFENLNDITYQPAVIEQRKTVMQKPSETIVVQLRLKEPQ
jgi:hypothetical protein